MNALTAADVHVDAGNVLVPQNLDQAMRLATIMSRAKMVPRHLQGDEGTCLMVVEQSMRWKASPFAVAQCTFNVGGKLAYEGKLIAAILPSCGAIVGELNYEYSGDPDRPDTLSVTVTGRRASDGEIKSISLAWSKARTSNEYWTKQPEQQLCYAGARVWARRWTPGPLLGIYAPEEFDEPKPAEAAFKGTTLDAEPGNATGRNVTHHVTPPPPGDGGMPRDQGVGSGADVTHPSGTVTPSAPKRTMTMLLDAMEADLERAATLAEIDAILDGKDGQYAQDHARNGARSRFLAMMQSARDRLGLDDGGAAHEPVPDDDWPGPDPEAMRREAAARAPIENDPTMGGTP